MLVAMRQAMIASKVHAINLLKEEEDAATPIEYQEAFRLATLGGSEGLWMESYLWRLS